MNCPRRVAQVTLGVGNAGFLGISDIPESFLGCWAARTLGRAVPTTRRQMWAA